MTPSDLYLRVCVCVRVRHRRVSAAAGGGATFTPSSPLPGSPSQTQASCSIFDPPVTLRPIPTPRPSLRMPTQRTSMGDRLGCGCVPNSRHSYCAFLVEKAGNPGTHIHKTELALIWPPGDSPPTPPPTYKFMFSQVSSCCTNYFVICFFFTQQYVVNIFPYQ